MGENLVMNAGDTRSFDAGLASVQVGVGSVIITDGKHNTHLIDADSDDYDAEGEPSLAFYSPRGAILAVTYADEVPVPQEPAERASGVSAKKRAKKAA